LARAVAASGGAWRDAASAWQVAAIVGAPLARTLRSVADALREAEQTRDDVRVALAEPAATARLVAWLPLVAVGLALVLGFDLAVTLTHPVGAACLAGGALLMLAARVWTRRLVARAQPSGAVAGLSSEMLAIALSGGVSIPRAEEVLASVGVTPGPADREVLALSATAGAPAVELLRASADLERHRARVAGRLRAAELSSRLLLPLGVCTLPAFLLVGVAPMLLSVMAGTPVTL
jgi:tight adherence protein B